MSIFAEVGFMLLYLLTVGGDQKKILVETFGIFIDYKII